MLEGPKVLSVLYSPLEEGVLPGRLHRVRRDQDPVEGQRLQQRPEVGDLVRLPGLRDLVLADDQAGTWVTTASRCTFRFPPALASLRSLPSTAAAGPAGTCPGS